MNICVRHSAKTKQKVDDPWKEVTRHVVYGEDSKHRDIVEQEFRWHLNLEVDYMRINHPDHFGAPHNVARAILVFHYFRPHHLFFDQDKYDLIGVEDLPTREADVQGEDFKVWVDFGAFSA